MLIPKSLKMAHEEVQKKIFLMLPEKWDRLYLYASIIDHFNKLQTGEMFFFYYPKGLLKKKPVNVYEVPVKFNIDEKQYFKLAEDLYDAIKKLREECVGYGEKAWTNVTISFENLKYRAEYGHEELAYSEEDINARHVIWVYKYLHTPYESFSKDERKIIDDYLSTAKADTNVYEAPLYIRGAGRKVKEINEAEKKMKFVTEEKIQEMEYINNHIPKSQILK